MSLKIVAAAGLAAFLAAPPALAGEAGDILREALYAGNLDGGLSQLAPMRDGDNEALFGYGFITLVQGIEALSQALYRHGAVVPAPPALLGGNPSAEPPPANPNPEPLDYAKVRDIVMALRDRLDEATMYFTAAGESGDYVVLIDPFSIKFDADGDGIAEPTETIAAMFAPALGMAQQGSAAPAPDQTIGFDRADAIWLAGYSQVFVVQAEFLLAHNFESFVNATFHRFFPRAGFPMQDSTADAQPVEGMELFADPATDRALADAVAGLHTLNWPVEHPELLLSVQSRLSRIVNLSRANWDAILAETDDNRELVPNPNQTTIFPDTPAVTDEIVAAWRETLDVAEQIIDGELLIPHWRFKQGFDLAAYFQNARHTDLVMLITGYDAIPYLRDGPIASAESFAAANRVFGDNFMGYMFWFN